MNFRNYFSKLAVRYPVWSFFIWLFSIIFCIYLVRFAIEEMLTRGMLSGDSFGNLIGTVILIFVIFWVCKDVLELNMNSLRIYFLKLAARNPIWRFFVGFIHLHIFWFFVGMVAFNFVDISEPDETVILLILCISIIFILTYTFFLGRFSNPSKLKELLKSEEMKRKEAEKKEKKRISDNKIKLPKTINIIRKPIKESSTIVLNSGKYYSQERYRKIFILIKDYMPSLLHEVRKEVHSRMREREIGRDSIMWDWDKIVKNYDKYILHYVHFDFYPASLAEGALLRVLSLGLYGDEGGKADSQIINKIIYDVLESHVVRYFEQSGWRASRHVIENSPVIYLDPPV